MTPTPTPPTCLLLDLDGTLVDSAPGVLASIRAALREVGVVAPDPGVLRTFVGPPMYESFQHRLGLDEPTALRALAAYRAHYAAHGALDSALYDGIVEALKTLAAAGLPMGVATSKVEDQARRIIAHYGLDPRFEAVCGIDDRAGRTTKRQVIRECLARLARRGVDVSAPLMVGDRSYDVTSAAAEGIPAVHVLWGYGDRSESADAIASVADPAELTDLLIAARDHGR
ncbi:HAD hydrolase-like protein [Streptomyces sp. NPDC005970]|uniref:HAD hydrolase-like protein n=1 Tax=Streptomyces sp. NPDC005970 TaxID=3156723 RepID=UPI0033C67443